MHFGSLRGCTMEYLARAAAGLGLRPVLRDRHPLAPAATGQGFLACLWELQDILARVTGMAGVSLTPLAGAQGELAGIAMIEAYHRSRGDSARREILVPDAAHGTNPATAAALGFTVKPIPANEKGRVDLAALKAALPSAAAYVGLLGARRRLAGRLDELKFEGMAASALARLHAPIGLDIGGKAPFEVAVSVIGEITALRYARANGSTSTTSPALNPGASASLINRASDAAKTLTSEES